MESNGRHSVGSWTGTRHMLCSRDDRDGPIRDVLWNRRQLNIQQTNCGTFKPHPDHQ